MENSNIMELDRHQAELRVTFNPGKLKDPRWTGHRALSQWFPSVLHAQTSVLTLGLQLVAERALPEVSDVYALALTYKELWAILESELYRTDILRTKEEERKTIIRFREAFPGMLYGDQQGPQPKRTRVQKKLMSELHIQYFDRTCAEPTDEFLNIRIVDIQKAEDRLRMFHMRPSIHLEVPPIILDVIWNAQITPERRSKMIHNCLQASATVWPGYLDVKRYGGTPLMLATLKKDYGTTELLIKSGCFVDSWVKEPKGMRKWKDDGSMEIVRKLEVKPLYYDSTRAYMYRPLSVAIATRQADLALMLAQNTRDGGWVRSYEKDHPISDLLLASFAGMAPVVRALLELGYPVEQGLELRHRTSLLPKAQALHAAAAGVDSNIRVLKVLFEHGATIDDIDGKSPTCPIYWALKHGAPRNALFILSQYLQSATISNEDKGEVVATVVRESLESEALLPVLDFFVEKAFGKVIFTIISHCRTLNDRGFRMSSATTKFLQDKGINQSGQKRKFDTNRRGSEQEQEDQEQEEQEQEGGSKRRAMATVESGDNAESPKATDG